MQSWSYLTSAKEKAVLKTLTGLLEVSGVDPSPGLDKSSYMLLTGGAPLLSLCVGTTGCGGEPPAIKRIK